ncbi:UNVERIFIED_CONTAM: blmp-1, partial [Trichonephila clavipes]
MDTKESLLMCQECNETYSLSDSLKRHLCTHTKKEPFVCEICKKAFSKMAHLKRHSVVHTK